ncbi:MAG: S8 family serine peptidase [Chloroflexi bacterium]|nr:S8 family serine peptidase [Chloroflexota bacterium]
MIKRCLVILVLLALFAQFAPGGLLPARSAQAQEPVAAAKISGLLAQQVQAKLQAVKSSGLSPASEGSNGTGRLSPLNLPGIRLEDLNKQRAFIHFNQPPTQAQIAELTADNLTLHSDSWIPPVGNHPTGFLVADMPVDKLGAVAAKPYVARLETAETVLEPLNDLGTQKMNVPAVWASGYNGAGVRIAVLDSGLDLTSPDFPTPVAKKDFSNYPTSLDDNIANTVSGHGTHVTGSVLGRGTQSGGVYKGSAPGADLIFLKIGTDDTGGAPTPGMVAAIKAAADNYSADIITMSYGGWSTFHDGSSESAQAVDYAVSRGVVTLIATGNDASSNRHYSGTVNANSATGFIPINVTAGNQDTGLWLNMVYFDGLGTSKNLSLQFYDPTQNVLPTFNYTEGESPRGTESRPGFYGDQNGNPFPVPQGTSTAFVKVTNSSPSSQLFHLYVNSLGAGSVKFQSADPYYTIASPADADGAIAVGAYVTRTSWTNYKGAGPVGYGFTLDTIAPFSNRGPRVDNGTPKPNIVAPGSVIISVRDTVVYPQNATNDPYIIDNDGLNLNGSGPADYYVMQGTSMATPLAAGVAALILQKNPTWTVAQVKNALETTATDKGAAGHDNDYGWGLVNAQAATADALSVTTNNATNITSNSTTLNGTLDGLGSASANVSFEWGTTSGSLNQFTAAQVMTGIGSFSANVTGLSANTTYYFRAKAVADVTAFGAEKSFTTLVPPGKILFVSDRDGNLEIYRMDADGSNPTRLTNNTAYDNMPSPGSNGTKIAFVSGRDGNREIYAMNADGSSPTRLTNNTAGDIWPVWSRDGTKIVFVSDRDGNNEIYVMNADGSSQTRLTNNTAGDNFPVWSPDGTKIAFNSGRDGGDFPEIYVMNADGSSQTRLTNNTASDNFPIWSADGTKIAFSSERDGNWEIYNMNVDGSSQTRVTNTPGYDNWQPKGLSGATPRIAFTSNRDGNSEIYAMETNGTNQTRLTSNTVGDWSRGKWIAPTVTTDNATSVTNSTAILTGNLTALGSSGTVGVSFQWGTTSGSYTNATTLVLVNATGAFSANLTGLSGNATYYFRARAGGDGGNFGTERNFTSGPSVSLVSIAVAPTSPTITLGQTRQFTATGTYSDTTTANLTATAIWTSSNSSVATISATGLATSTGGGTTVITATSGGISGNTTLTVTVVTKVEVNLGNTVILTSGQTITANTTSGIPIDVKNIATTAEGLAAFDFTITWNPAVIRVDAVRKSTAAADLGWGFTIGAINNTTGNVSFVGTTTQTPYSKANLTLAYLGITAVGNPGDNTTIALTITDLLDNAVQSITPRSAVNAPLIITSPVAETSIAQAKDSDGVVVVMANIDRIKDPFTGLTANITGGIGNYRATVNSSANGSIQFLAVRGVSPFDSPSFNATTGVFSVDNVTSLIQANNTTAAKVVPILTGNTTTSFSLTIAFQAIGAAGDPGLNVPEEHSNTITLLRGDADKSGVISIADSLTIKQYLVGQLTMSQINPLNAASVNHDGAGGDKITVTDALGIEQKLVGQVNAYFQ